MKFFPLQVETVAVAVSNATLEPTQLIIKLNSLIAALIRSNQNSSALKVFTQIHSSHHLRPDHYTLVSSLTACANLHDTVAGDQLHSHAIRAGFKAYAHVGNSLLSLYAKSKDLNNVIRLFGEITIPDVYTWTILLSAYAKSGQIDYACQLFDGMLYRNSATWNACQPLDVRLRRNIATWNAIITGCVENGREGTAVEMFLRMHRWCVGHDHYTFASVLSLCCSPALVEFGRQVHSLVTRTGFLVRVSVVNALLTMYFNCDVVRGAYGVFEEAKVSTCNQITYNAMIQGLVSYGRDREALDLFMEMREACLAPTELTFVTVMSSSSFTGTVNLGRQVHAQIVKMGFEAYTSVSNATITMYSSCTDLDSAWAIFERLEEKDSVSWNSMISGCAQCNCLSLAIMVYLQMQRAGLETDDFTVGSLLSYSDSLVIVKLIQALVVKNGLLSDILVCNALVSSYSKHGLIEHAFQVFHGMCSQNLISWNTIISGCLFNGLPLLGLDVFRELLLSELRPNLYSLTVVLSTCASIAALRHGKQVHSYILKFGFGLETPLGNALITMYAKCGILDWASKVFSRMIQRDIVSWNAMICAYAQHGEGKEAIRCFKALQNLDDVKPDEATFTAVLSACSHAGLVDQGCQVFFTMVDKYGIIPGVDHCSCIIDLLGRAGHLDEAGKLINVMPVQTDSRMWWALLGACQAHGNVLLGRVAAGVLLEIEPDNSAVYVQLANIYAAAGQWNEAANVREMMKNRRVVKQPAYSWIE
ncbi:pentatricopeptide repeat-containing protein At3g49740 [Macadamia integrifolia]|uniref:pentatricopeptide repeat-containing protein At3g49740 n=1 Tax=Macadamia integrifolia TaxID=60698 RepID=UPI001C4F2381|nr:pentatricopeptide repeat-containing protein At3g49740 [Macadamia integrifolia]XP_042518397.1 pentatricopeptide repeat-containing protein At3g49740 [Macadamia integrifolia]XP_042518398.1 pentatricopeptide repeat-containing protein At3g49740 [Macadamia integrifolia]XP_042518399.1 pentatricopeptide repeat-containing protein At3g49740 [Macadamia integrifolia]XP_042518400.1 pentatricopeptide repeat-containing protein At3g49740 [Macadamia integrifolia]